MILEPMPFIHKDYGYKIYRIIALIIVMGGLLLILFNALPNSLEMLTAQDTQPPISAVPSDSADIDPTNQSLNQTTRVLAEPSLESDFTSERKTISWHEFNKRIQTILPNYTKEQLTQELAELDVQAKYEGGDINLSATTSYNLSVDPEHRSGGTENKHNITISPQISKKFLHTGTDLTLGLNSTLGTTTIDDATPIHNSTITPKLTIKQDILRNFFGLLARQDIANTKQILEIAKQQRRYNERKLQKSYDQQYLEWILLWRKQKVLVEQLRKSTASLNNARSQRQLNYINDATYQRIYNSHLRYRKTLRTNEQQLLSIDQKFARFLGNGRYQPDLSVIEPLLKKAKEPLEVIYFEDSWVWAISEQSLRRLSIVHKFVKLQRLPSLTLTGSLSLETSAQYRDTEQPEYSQLKPNYSVSIQLSWPVLMRKARNTVKRSEIQLQQLEEDLEIQRQNFGISIARQYANHKYLLESYAIQQETAKANAAIYQSEQVEYRQARASVRDLLDSEIQTLSAELNLLQIENDLIKQKLDYYYETRHRNILHDLVNETEGK